MILGNQQQTVNIGQACPSLKEAVAVHDTYDLVDDLPVRTIFFVDLFVTHNEKNG